jgi:DNA-binding transcriptional ArsR family regulator
VPLAGEGRVVTTWSDGMRDVLDVIRTEREWTTAEIAAHPDIDIGERQVRKHLTSLYEQGVLDREVEGCGFIWTDDGVHRVGEHGEVELEDVDVDELIDAKSAELARTVIYTWEFRRSPSESPGPAPDTARDGRGGSSGGFDGGDRPPDGGVTQR